jgi:hypothetical protein
MCSLNFQAGYCLRLKPSPATHVCGALLWWYHFDVNPLSSADKRGILIAGCTAAFEFLLIHLSLRDNFSIVESGLILVTLFTASYFSWMALILGREDIGQLNKYFVLTIFVIGMVALTVLIMFLWNSGQ